jgi:hypothetical protein
MVGVFVIALVIGVVAQTLQNLGVIEQQIRKHLENLNSYMKYHNTPDFLYEGVRAYFKYLVESKNAVGHQIIAELPDSMVLRLIVAQNRNMVQQVTKPPKSFRLNRNYFRVGKDDSPTSLCRFLCSSCAHLNAS